MSDKNQEFWKELMGEDFKVEPGSGFSTDGQDGAPEPPKSPPPAEPERRGGETPGFTVEYISRESAPPPSGTEGRIQRPITPEGASGAPRPSRPETGRIQRPITPGDTPRRPANSGERPSQPTQRPASSGERPSRPAQRPSQPAQRPSQSAQRPSQSAQRPAGSSEPSGGRRGKKSKEDKFEVEFDFDSEYADVDEKAVRRGRTKRTGCLSGILMFLFVVCVSAVLASVGWMWATDVLGLDGHDEQVEVTLPEDFFHTEERMKENEEGEEVPQEVSVADMDRVAEELYQKGLIEYKWLFKVFSKLSHADEKLKAGTYTLNMVYDYRAIVHGMTGTKTTRDATTVTIPEGYSITQIVELLVDSGVCEKQELLDALKDHDFDYEFLKDGDVPPLGDPKRLEGYLFPDTYEFYIGDDPVNVIRKFLNNFELKWEEDFDALAAERGYTRRQILNIAAMIEKEAGGDAERDLVASVIYNRLTHPDRQGTNGYLQIDATIYYVTADTGEEFSVDLDSPYNTYLNTGLPTGPIANPGLASIRAALQPRQTDYYYYALGTNRLHQFFETYGEFTDFVNSDKYGGKR